MYLVINISTGIVAARFASRENANHWLTLNNFDDDGNSLGLYKIVKGQ